MTELILQSRRRNSSGWVAPVARIEISLSHVEAVGIKLISASISHQINPEWNTISTALNRGNGFEYKSLVLYPYFVGLIVGAQFQPNPF